ncbi:40S ribosomal protein S5-1 [Hordeum vulgare]|nr:40S ribosomal protein S5-1 [Hordeum vulgare]
MASPKVPKDKFFEKVINPYLAGVLQHPQSIEMHEGVLHIRDVEGPKKTGSVEARLEAMEQQVFKCQGMVERGLNANHMMITEFTNKHKIDANDIGKHLSRLYDRIDHLQAQIYDLQNQNYAKSRKKLNSSEEDVDFIPEKSNSHKQKVRVIVKKTIRKEYDTLDSMRAPQAAKKGTTLSLENPTSKLAKKPGQKKARKRCIHVVGRPTSMYEDPEEATKEEDGERQ